MKKLIIMSAIALVGCAGTPKTGEPLRTECVDTGEISSFTVMIREPKRIQEMSLNLPHSSHTSATDQVDAFTGINASGQVTVVLPPIRGQTDHERMALWGHELAHIICGSFHN